MKRLLSAFVSLFMVLSLTSPVYAKKRTNWTNLLEDEIIGHYWFEGIQSSSILSFNEDGIYTRYGVLGIPNASNYTVATVSGDTVPTSEDLEAATQAQGTYTFENGTLVMDKSGYVLDLYKKDENVELSDESANTNINNFDGDYFLYETDFEPVELAASQQAWYLLQLGKKSSTSSTETNEEDTEIAKDKLVLNQTKVSASDWKSGYKDCINNLYNEYDNYRFALVNINDDKIPELVAAGDLMFCPSHAFTYKKGKIYDLTIPFNGLASYQQKKNLLYCSSYRAGVAYDSVYSIGKKGFKFKANGVYYCDMNGESDEVDYYMNGKPVKNESKYQKKLKKVYDTENSSVKDFYSILKEKDEVLEEIDNYE